MFRCSYATLLVLNVSVSVCLGSQLCMTYFPTHLKLTPFTPAWQRTPVHVVVNNSQWPSAPLTFTCYKLIMISSVVRLINLCETETYGSLFLCEGWRGHRFCCALSKRIHIWVLMGEMWKLLFELFWDNSCKMEGRQKCDRSKSLWERITHDAWQCCRKCLISPRAAVTFLCRKFVAAF